jgi:hypothetical protein
MQPTSKAVNETLAQMEAAERDPNHPRSLARQAVKRWRSDAEKQGLPVANTTTGSGAPLLDVDAVLHHADHTARLGRK